MAYGVWADGVWNEAIWAFGVWAGEGAPVLTGGGRRVLISEQPEPRKKRTRKQPAPVYQITTELPEPEPVAYFLDCEPIKCSSVMGEARDFMAYRMACEGAACSSTIGEAALVYEWDEYGTTVEDMIESILHERFMGD